MTGPPSLAYQGVADLHELGVDGHFHFQHVDEVLWLGEFSMLFLTISGFTLAYSKPHSSPPLGS